MSQLPCRYCRFSEVAIGYLDTGICRRYPPNIVWWRAFFRRKPQDSRFRMAYWPCVDLNNSWCGEWQPRPEKLKEPL